MSQAAVTPRVTVRDVLADREFRAMYAAQALSVVGDQLARIAVAVLVFNRSHSALLTAVSFAVPYLPWVVGGPLLAGYADRLPRRTVMIASDLIRVVLVLAIAVPGMPRRCCPCSSPWSHSRNRRSWPPGQHCCPTSSARATA